MNILLNFERLLSESIVERLGWMLVHSLWQFALVALLAGVAVRTMRRRSASARYGVLIVAMAASVAGPLATGMRQSADVRAPIPSPAASVQEYETVANSIAEMTPPAIDPMPANEFGVESSVSESMAATLPTEVAGSSPAIAESHPVMSWKDLVQARLRPWLAWIVAGWSVGVAMFSVRPLLGWRTLHRLKRRGVSPVGNEVMLAMQNVTGRLGIRRAVQVLQSTLAHVPVVVGYFRPVILLPVSLVTSIPVAQLEAILAHELAHVRRHDFVVNLLQTLVETLFFYHPAVWWLSHQIRIEREHCCDDLVVKLLGNRVEYGRALVAIEQGRDRHSVLALGASDGSLLSRVKRILGVGTDQLSRSPWPGLSLFIGCSCVILAMSILSWRGPAEADVGRSQAQYRVTLPNGIEVELLGIATEKVNSAWWAADGALLEKPPLIGLQTSDSSDSPARCQVFAVRIRGTDHQNRRSVAVDNAVGPSQAVSATDALFESVSCFSTMGTPGTRVATVRVGIGRGESGPPQSISPKGEKLPVTLPDNLLPWYGAWSPQSVEVFEGQTRLHLNHDLVKVRYPIEWSVVDRDGQSHPLKKAEYLGPDPRTIEIPLKAVNWIAPVVLTFDLPLARIDHFEYRLTPFQYLVAFENVSLKPGQKTDVQVSVETPKHAAPDAPLITGPAPELGLGQESDLVQWSHNSQRLLATGHHGKLTFWELKPTGWDPTSLDAGDGLNSISVSRKSPLIVVGTNVGTAQVWDQTTRKRQGELRSSSAHSVYAVAISPDDKWVAACGTDGTIAVFDLATAQLIARLGEKADTRMSSLAFSPDNKMLAAIDREGTVALWNLGAQTWIAEWKGIAGGEGCSAQWSPDGRQLAVSGPGRVTLVAAEKGSQPQVVIAPEEVLSRFPKDDARNINSGPFPGGIKFASMTAIAADVLTVASIAPDGSVGIWDLATRKLVQKLPAPPETVFVKDWKEPGLRNLVFSPDGRRLACTTERGDVVFWQLAQAAAVLQSEGLGAFEVPKANLTPQINVSDPLDAPAAKPDPNQPEADQSAIEAKTRDLDKLLMARNDALKSNSDIGTLDFNIAMERVRLARLRLRLAEARNLVQPGSNSAEALETLKRETLVRWGNSVNGVQIGLERVSLQDSFWPDDVVEFRRRVRNVTTKTMQITLRFPPQEKMKRSLDAQGLLFLNVGGRPTESVMLTLPPGQDQPIPGSEILIDTKGMLPGEYRVESNDRIVLNDTNVGAEQITAYSSSWNTPNDLPLTFGLLAVASRDKPDPFVLQGGPEIAWGTPVQGLQGGLRYTRGLVRPGEFSHPDNWEWNISDTVQAEFLVRNVLPTAVPVTYAVSPDDKLVELDPHAHIVQPYDFGVVVQPRWNKTRIVRVEGHPPTDRERTQLLQPGEALVIAKMEFQFTERPKDKADLVKLPRENLIQVAPATRYSFYTRMSVRSSLVPTLNLNTGRTRLWLRDPKAQPAPLAAIGQGIGEVSLRYDIPGAAAQAVIVIRSLREGGELLARTVTNGGKAVLLELPVGHYELYRQLTLTVGSWTNTFPCERQRISVTRGKVAEVGFERPQASLTAAKGEWKDLANRPVEGAFLTIHAVDENQLVSGDIGTYFDFEIDRVTLAATTCKPDGKFTLETLPPGNYVVVLRAVRKSDSKDAAGTAMPSLVGVERFRLLDHNNSDATKVAHFYPSTFRIRPSWNTPRWSPTRVSDAE